jgi:hypothetical protein
MDLYIRAVTTADLLLLAIQVGPGVRRAGLPRLSPPLAPGAAPRSGAALI